MINTSHLALAVVSFMDQNQTLMKNTGQNTARNHYSNVQHNITRIYQTSKKITVRQECDEPCKEIRN